ncbi:hypothetical protein [Haloarchaeobius amylolyticus]|uniref:hypothetical protein n=1 Tax=Haloarchaeobius amylolyticus TaxID=1198296 RepID=UPI00226FD056|nr:hypothetical protein [Haloarchaeobius amylolyticus]
MTEEEEAGKQLDDPLRVARLQGIRSYVEDDKYGYLDLAGIYSADPLAETPFVVTGTFIPEEIGGSVTVVNSDRDPEETLARENLNQMLNNFLPGGYKKRWGNFDLWRGAWDHQSKPGHADIGPMFDWADSYPLTELLGDVSDVAYTEPDFDPQAVRVYEPLSVRVTQEDKGNPSYVWIPEKGLPWIGNPPMASEDLSSDPTTNYLWFKHSPEPFDADLADVDSSELIAGFSFDDQREFVRCYYASLLTLYPRNGTRTRTETVRYRNEADDTDAFVASHERSQLLTFELDRDTIRSRIEHALETHPRLKRDLQFALLESNIWKRLFFHEEAIDHVFAIDPLVEHLMGVDYWQREVKDEDLGVFGLPGTRLARNIERLLPDDSSRHLRILGHEDRAVSDVHSTVKENPGPLAELLARSRNDELLMNFAERVFVHSAEHALSTWSNDLTGSGTSFELWYDLKFQEEDSNTARIAVYDPIQGGAGIAKEVHGHLREESPDIESGLAAQARCHSATADRATIDLLASYPDGSLYDIYRNDHEDFLSLVRETIESWIDGKTGYSVDDLVSYVEQRTQSLFETRELAEFYSYVASEYESVEEVVGRVPRVVDLALHLDRHVFTDPSIKTTYDRFANDSGRRDIAELGERLGELTVQCVTACPDCLKTDPGLCLHGTGQQEAQLNRRLLAAVLTQ